MLKLGGREKQIKAKHMQVADMMREEGSKMKRKTPNYDYEGGEDRRQRELHNKSFHRAATIAGEIRKREGYTETHRKETKHGVEYGGEYRKDPKELKKRLAAWKKWTQLSDEEKYGKDF